MNVTHVKDLYPTGSCYEDISDIWNVILEPIIKKGREDIHKTVRICHGILTDETGKLFSHAWVEHHRSVVYECKRINSYEGEKCVISLDRGEYHIAHKITDWKAYTLREFALLQLEHGHCGPFENRYHALTKDAHLRPPPRAMEDAANATREP